MPIPDNSQRKTRVYRREQEDRQPQPYDERIGFTQPLAPRHRPLDGISAAQVVAGAAAAATSMLLASKIGIAGSVIGAAVSSAVTIICSQLYRHALETSAEKLKLSQLGISGDNERPSEVDAYRSGRTPVGYRGTRIAPAALQIRAAEERHSTQRKVLVASVVLAAAAVALTAGIILLGTAGQGLGTRPEPLLPMTPAQQPAGDTAAPDNAAANTPTTENDTSQQPSDGDGANEGDSPDGGPGTDGKDGAGNGETAPAKPDPDQGTSGEPNGAESGASSENATDGKEPSGGPDNADAAAN